MSESTFVETDNQSGLYKPAHRVTGKYILRARLTLASPLLIGQGEGDDADIALIRDAEGCPFIPGSSLAGKVKAAIDWEEITDKQKIKNVKAFWGTDNPADTNSSQDDQISQSHVIFHDLYPEDQKTARNKVNQRDSVRIDPEKGTAVEGGKYDYELLEPGVTFVFRAEVTLRQEFSCSIFEQCIAFIKKVMETDLRLGALTTTGFGKLDVVQDSFAIHKFAFPTNAQDWINYVKGGEDYNALPQPTSLDAAPLPIKDERQFKIEADFAIKSALITGSAGVNHNEPDKAQLKSNGKFVLSGKAIKGALRHRALKILNTLGYNGEYELEKWMGWVRDPQQDEEGKHGYKDDKQQEPVSAIKSRFHVEESLLSNVEDMEQQRIRIDRFTGGVIDGGLFSSAPVWRKHDGSHVRIELTLEEYDHKNEKDKAALLLHLLKDLWTEDLAIGGEKNVGRGILEGQSATIKWEDKEAIIRNNNGQGVHFDGDADALKQEFNEALQPKEEAIS